MKIHQPALFTFALILSIYTASISAANNQNVITVQQFPQMSVISMQIGAENNINIGSISSGGGAGKASFKELIITKLPDSTTSTLLNLLTSGTHLDALTISQGNVTWDLSLVMVQDYSSSSTAGKDGGLEETWIMQFGSMQITVDGQSYCWDRVLNQACPQ